MEDGSTWHRTKGPGREPGKRALKVMRIRSNALLRVLGLLVLLGLSCLDSRAETAAIDVGQAQADFVPLAAHFSALEDASGDLSLADVLQAGTAQRFKRDPQRSSDLNFGPTRSTIWLRLELKNSSDQPVERLLELGSAAYMNVQFHAPAADGGYTAVTSGRVLPFASRAYPNRFFVFPISLPAHAEQTFYVRVKSNAVVLPAKLWTAAAFHRHERLDYAAQGIYFGVATAMLLFNLFLFAVMRDRMYLWYLVAPGTVALTMAEQSGLAKEFFWPNLPSWSLVAMNTGYMLAPLTLTVFTRRMLDTATSAPRWDRYLKILSSLYLLGVTGLLLDSEQVAPLAAWLGLIGLGSILGCGIYCAVLRVRSAYFFVAAYSVMLISAVLYAMRSLSMLSSNTLMAQSLQFGSALEMIILALALADRFFQIRLESVRAGRTAFAAQTQLIDVLQTSERQLEQRVSESTNELSNAFRELQAAQSHLVESQRRATEGEKSALQAMAAQQQFIAMVSHEFRSPLAVIDNSAQLLARTLTMQTDSKAAALVARIRRGTVRLAQFLDSCLTQDRLRDVDRLQCVAPIDVAALANGASESAQLLAEQHRILTEVAPDLPPLQGDAELMRILLANLLSNSIKYSKCDCEIRLRATHVDDKHIFEVIDQGSGIPPDEMPDLFKKYQRGRLAAGKPGAGLGLALCRQIVKLHGGHIQVQSTQDVGTRVLIEIPAESIRDAHTSQFD